MSSVTVYSHRAFNEFCKANSIDDANVETQFCNCAFISIICSSDAKEEFGSEIFTKHYFDTSHKNVLNIEFDDIPQDRYPWKAITPEQATVLVEFIEENLGNDIIVHCFAGKSRSQAVCHFIRDTYSDVYTNFNNINSTPNVKVLLELNHAYARIHNINKEQIYTELFS